jgi:uncharacterized RDD family membrane protein YckC
MSTPTNNNFAPPRSAVADVSAGNSSFEKATRASRFGATLIDGLLFVIPFAPSYFAAFSHLGAGGLAHSGAFGFWRAVIATGAPFWAGVVIDLVLIAITTVLVHRNGQTIGKKLLGIKVVRTDGSRATLARIFWLRYFANSLIILIPMVGRFYSLIDSLMIFGESRRCCHDHIADTIVVRA